jgi:L-ascorbate metabolism protein UlaG (beta-lactamase superfamily)
MAAGKRGLRRRTWLGGVGLGLAGVGAGLVYRTAPSFWQQYAREFGRPIDPPPTKPRPKSWPDKGLHAAWIGHATVLLKIDGFTILTDPVFSTRVGIGLGPFTLGLKRLVEPALELEELPHIDLVLLSHAHMDHFDLPSLRALERRKPEVVTARGTSDLLRVARYRRVEEIGWGQELRAGPAVIRGLEVRHWGARMRTDTWRGYNGYLIKVGRHRVLFGGDTAMTDAFRHVGGAGLAIMPIGAYNPWIRAHCNPEQAWTMASEHARADCVLPVHHGTFSLSREPAGEPLERLLACAGRDTRRVVLRQVGETASLA